MTVPQIISWNCSADETGLPDDPEFRSVFAWHLEWGSRVALINSQLDENPVTKKDHIPEWGWGEVKGPYEIVGSLFQQKRGNAENNMGTDNS
jgi:hemoglobin